MGREGSVCYLGMETFIVMDYCSKKSESEYLRHAGKAGEDLNLYK